MKQSFPVESKAKVGDVYQLGNHRLMCGDCINQTHIDTLLEGNMADLVVTDPPYNMAYEGAGKTPDDKRKTNKILNDKMPEEDFERFLTAVNRMILYQICSEVPEVRLWLANSLIDRAI